MEAVLGIKCSKELYNAVHKAADADARSVSGYIRNVLRQAAERDVGVKVKKVLK